MGFPSSFTLVEVARILLPFIGFMRSEKITPVATSLSLFLHDIHPKMKITNKKTTRFFNKNVFILLLALFKVQIFIGLYRYKSFQFLSSSTSHYFTPCFTSQFLHFFTGTMARKRRMHGNRLLRYRSRKRPTRWDGRSYLLPRYACSRGSRVPMPA